MVRQSVRVYLEHPFVSRMCAYVCSWVRICRYFIRGQTERAAASDYVVSVKRRARLQDYDTYLRKFRHRDALTAALATGRGDVLASVVSELLARGALPQVGPAVLSRGVTHESS